MNDRMLSDEILLGLIKANSGGGGGGTTDYDDLSNKPQIAGTTLSGNKSLADLGIASASDVETALDRKQDVLLYGGANPSTGADGDMYVKLVRDESTLIDMFGSPSAESTDDYEMSYAVDSSVMGDYYDYEAFGTGKGFGQNGRGSMTITYHFKNSKFKPVNVSYCNNFSLSGGGYLESANFTIKASNDGTNWDTLYSTSSSCPRDTSVSADITANTYYSYFKFEMNSGGGYTGIRNIVMNGISESYSNIDNIYFKNDGTWLKDSFAHKSEIDAIKDGTSIDSFADVETALTGKQDTLTFDDTPTDNSNNPVKSNGIYDALALKQNATDNNLETEAKTIVGAINENANDISSLESGLTTLDNEVNGDATTYPYADVITIEDAVPSNLADCSVKVDPQQNLHGYDKPWVGGAGKNKLDATGANGTSSGVTFTVDNTENPKVTISGTFSTVIYQKVNDTIQLKPNTTYTCSGCASSFQIRIREYDENNVLLDSHEVSSKLTFTTNNLLDHADVYFIVYSMTATTIYPQIEEGSTDSTFATYTNICPISGHTEASVQRDGRNLIESIENGTWNTTTQTKKNQAARARVSNIISVLPTKKYTFSIKTQTGYETYVKVDYYAGLGVASNGSSDWQPVPYTCTIPDNAKYVTIEYGFTTSTEHPENYTSDAQFELGQTATTYAPYVAGQTYTIALGDTIYGGIVRIDSNGNTVMDVDDVKKVFDGSEDETWTTRTTQSGYTLFEIILSNTRHSTSQTQVGLCNEFPWSITYETDKSYRYYQTTLGIRYDGLTPTEFKEWLSSNELEVTLPLATPTTIQLTPQQIQLLKGVNTLTASTGDISVTVNGVSGAIGVVQEQVNATDEALAELAEKLPTAPTTDGAYVLTVTVADGTPTYSWESTT